MKVDLTVLLAGIKHLIQFFFSSSFFAVPIQKITKKKKQIISIFCASWMMLVKANTPNDKESGNSKKDGVK